MMKTLKETQEDLAYFLNENPEAAKHQWAIGKRLNLCKDGNERLEVIRLMILENLERLESAMIDLLITVNGGKVKHDDNVIEFKGERK